MLRRPGQFLTIAALALAPISALANDLAPGWALDAKASNIRFQSVKNETKVESSSFATFSGEIGPEGAAEIKIMLESVDTKIDLRNVRMRFLFFETFTFPEATITAQVTPEMIADLREVRRKTIDLPFSLDLHGVKKTLTAEVVATLLTDDRVSVATATPISVSVAEFDLTQGLQKLEEAAKVQIIPSATVTFDFLFDRSGPAKEVLSAQADDAAEQVVSVALEPEGNLDEAACLGRFEILSRSGNIYFRSGSSRLDQASAPLLGEVVDIVNRCPGLEIEIAGHTDSVGKDSSNQRLSELRAKSVATYLVNQGIPASRLMSKGYGESRPIADNETPEGKSKNRRIEFLARAQ